MFSFDGNAHAFNQSRYLRHSNLPTSLSVELRTVLELPYLAKSFDENLDSLRTPYLLEEFTGESELTYQSIAPDQFRIIQLHAIHNPIMLM